MESWPRAALMRAAKLGSNLHLEAARGAGESGGMGYTRWWDRLNAERFRIFDRALRGGGWLAEVCLGSTYDLWVQSAGASSPFNRTGAHGGCPEGQDPISTWGGSNVTPPTFLQHLAAWLSDLVLDHQ